MSAGPEHPVGDQLTRRTHRWNFWAMVGDGAFFSVGLAFFEVSTVLPFFIASYTSSAVLIGSVAAVKTAGWYVPQLPTALALLGRVRIKNFFLLQALIGRLALAAVVPVVFLAGRMPAGWLVASFLLAYAVFAFTEGAATLAWFDLVGKAISPTTRGRFFGMVQLLGGIVGVSAGVAVGWLLAADRLALPARFGLIFTFGSVAFLVSAACIALVHEPIESIGGETRTSAMREVTRLAGDAHLRGVAVSQILVGTLQLALPFYVIYGRDRLGLTPEWIGAFVVAQTVGATGTAMIWGWIAERFGARLVIRMAALLVVCVPGLALLAAAVRDVAGILLLLAYAVAGATIGGSKLGFWKYVLDLVNPRDRRVCFGLVNTGNSPLLLMPLVGGVLVRWGGYEVLFAVAVISGLIAVLSAFGLAEPRELLGAALVDAPAPSSRADP